MSARQAQRAQKIMAGHPELNYMDTYDLLREYNVPGNDARELAWGRPGTPGTPGTPGMPG